MKPPPDDAICVRCDHPFLEHVGFEPDPDPAESWKGECGCCVGGCFVSGEPFVVDDLDAAQMEAWIAYRKGLN